MRRYLLTLALMALASSAHGQQASPAKVTVDIRGHSVDVYTYAASTKPARGRIILAPGDGGWRGFAITIAETVSSWGYEVSGFDTRRYLETFTTGQSTLRETDVMADMHTLAESMKHGVEDRAIFAGWSEGAGLAVLAGVSEDDKKSYRGIIAIGLTESAVLGWRWADAVTYVTKKQADEPSFASATYLPKIASLPFLQIHSSGDEYTSVAAAKKLFSAAQEPKRFSLVQAQDHRFSGGRPEFFRALREGLDWMNTASH